MTGDTKTHTKRKLALVILASFLVGAVAAIGVNFATFKNNNVHHHANFALYINGKRDEFKSFTFYEEVNACASDTHNNPKERVHMHEQNGSLVHVHAPAVTWGHFFANIGYVLGDSVIKTDSGTYVAGVENNTLSFVLNGKPESSIANRVIQSEDKLLINYGRDDKATLQQRFERIPADAPLANTKHDPASCSGGERLTFWQRLKKAVIN